MAKKNGIELRELSILPGKDDIIWYFCKKRKIVYSSHHLRSGSILYMVMIKWYFFMFMI